MNVLIGCEKSGVVRDAFLAAGHDAVSCDLEPTQVSGPHLQCDVFDAVQSRRWDRIILHPECRKVCVSGNHVYAQGKPKWEERVAAARWIEALWHHAKNYSCEVVLENSVGVLAKMTNMGSPTQYIQPYQFGHDASKNTCLWMHGVEPLILDPSKFVAPRIVWDAKGKPWMRWANQTDSGQNKLTPSEDRSAIRAKTYSGIATALSNQK
jgi:hypothetical protein